MTNTPLNPDGVTAAQDALWNSGIGAQLRLMNEDCKIMSEIVLRVYLAAAQPEVNSVEELEALPLESVVRDKYGYVYLLEDEDDEFKWSRNGLDAHFPSWGIVLPAHVLYRPEVKP